MHVLEAAMVANLRLGRPGPRSAAVPAAVPRMALLRLAAALAAVGLFAATMDASSTSGSPSTAMCATKSGRC
jgi:hypothetical protein